MTTERYANDHPFGMSDQLAELARVNGLERARREALAQLRQHGPVLMPTGWGHHAAQSLAQTAAFVATTFVRRDVTRITRPGCEDALNARRSLVRDVRGTGAGRVSVAHRQAEYDYAVATQRPGTVALGDVLADAPASGIGVAVVTERSGHGTTTRTTYHLARVGEPVALPFGAGSVDGAVRDAQARLATGESSVPIGILRTSSGVRAVELQLRGAAQPLVTIVDGTGSALTWRATNRSLVAVVGVDGVVRPRLD